jgi:hypothetical protein
MKIIVSGSMTASKEMLETEKELVNLGHEVVLPEGTVEFASTGQIESSSQAIANKAHGDLIRGYFNIIESGDALLVVNPKKNGIPGYIGGNVFLEIGFAHALGKKIYIQNPLPTESPYLDELKAMNPIVINGNYLLIM